MVACTPGVPQRSDERENLVLLNQFLDGRNRPRRLKTVVFNYEPDLPSIHSAFELIQLK